MILAVDSETTGTDHWHGCRPFLVTACDGKLNYAWQGTVNPYNRLEVVWSADEINSLQTMLERADTLIFHNAKFDLHMLKSIGINLDPLWDKIEDTILASHCLCSGESHALKYLAFKYLDYDSEDEDELDQAVIAARANTEYDKAVQGHPAFPGLSGTKNKWYKMDMWMAPDECLKYAVGDVERTYLLWQVFKEAMEDHDLLEVYATRKKLIRIAFDMETVGYNMYADEVREEIAYLKDLRDTLTKQIQKEARIGYNMDLNTEKDKRFFLFTVLKLDPIYFSEKTGVASLNKDAINYMIESNPDIPAIQLYKEYRAADAQINALNGYLKWACDDGRLRSSLWITGTRNTRQSYSEPNLQNTDKRIRHVFGPPSGYVWIDFDLVSIEPRIWAYLTKSPLLISWLEAGKSPHILFSELLYPEEVALCERNGTKFKEVYELSYYKYVKATDLAIMYGAGKKRADATCHKSGAYDAVVEKLPEIPAFNTECTNEVESNITNYYAPFVTCLGGYRLDVPTDTIYVAPNYKIQGTAGWIIGEAMINIKANKDYLATKAQMILQVHDSIQIEVKRTLLTPALIDSLQKSIEDAGLKYLPTCKASYNVIYNPKDKAPF